MNREHWKELLPVITAFANGEDVQFKISNASEWKTRTSPDFSASPSCYRIAQTKPRKVWINDYGEHGLSMHESEQVANDLAYSKRIACHEIELPPLP
jgi:hypothetical protein